MRRDYDAVRRYGLKVFSHMGDFEIRPPVHDSAAALGRRDLVTVGLKTTENASLPDLLASVVGPETLVLTLQDSLGNEDEIARVMGQMAFPESRGPHSHPRRNRTHRRFGQRHGPRARGSPGSGT